MRRHDDAIAPRAFCRGKPHYWAKCQHVIDVPSQCANGMRMRNEAGNQVLELSLSPGEPSHFPNFQYRIVPCLNRLACLLDLLLSRAQVKSTKGHKTSPPAKATGSIC